MNSSATSRASFLRTPAYRREDYVGAFRHLLIFAIDGFVLVCTTTIALILVEFTLSLLAGPDSQLVRIGVGVTGLVVIWWYLVWLKRSDFRTPGYWIADAKIIALDGRPPSLLRMTGRLLWSLTWVMGLPMGFFMDWIWCTMNDERQMFRDLVFETRLVRYSAQPVGEGRVSYTLFTGLGWTFFHSRVRPKVAAPAIATPVQEWLT